MTHEDKRQQRLQLLDDHIGRALRENSMSRRSRMRVTSIFGDSVRVRAAASSMASGRPSSTATS